MALPEKLKDKLNLAGCGLFTFLLIAAGLAFSGGALYVVVAIVRAAWGP